MAHVLLNRTQRRKKRVSANIEGTPERPRIAVHRSNHYIYVQAIDDTKRVTIASASSVKAAKGTNKTEQAKAVGIALAKALKEKNVSEGVFDRGRYTYNGRVKALAEGLREGQLQI